MPSQSPPATSGQDSKLNVGDADAALPDLPQGQGAYERLLDEIRAGSLLPGARLREIDLAARLGISRTPVREAIRRLEADGLVEHLPRQGASLRRLSHAEVMELYEMRVVLEGTAARLAAHAASALELAELEEINAEMTGSVDPVQIARLNRQFHTTLLNAAKNRFLKRFMLALRRTSLVLGRSTLFDRDRVDAAAAEHADLLAALAARDAASAEAAMRVHIEAAHRSRLRQLRDAGLADDSEGWGSGEE
jgi:DNA-binding GntR family transcriptional regulator